MITEHDKLINILNELNGHEVDFWFRENDKEYFISDGEIYQTNRDYDCIDVREIIFTEDFMLQKLYTYLKARGKWSKFEKGILFNLDNLVDYIEIFMDYNKKYKKVLH